MILTTLRRNYNTCSYVYADWPESCAVCIGTATPFKTESARRWGGICKLDKYGIEYHIVKTYPNGVRVGYIPNHKDRRKQSGTNQSWFPRSWTSKDIKRAGEHVANLKSNKSRSVKDGQPIFGMWKGVRVGVIRTKGIIGTIFPDSVQPYTKGGSKK